MTESLSGRDAWMFKILLWNTPMHEMSAVVRHDGDKLSGSPEDQIRTPCVACLGSIGTVEKLADSRKGASSAESDKEE